MPPPGSAADPSEDRSEAPPFLSTWPRVYAAVLAYLALLLALLYAVTQAFRY